MLDTFRELAPGPSASAQRWNRTCMSHANGGVQMLNVNRAARIDDNAAFQRVFEPGRLTLGVFFPIEAFARDEPPKRDQERLARRA